MTGWGSVFEHELTVTRKPKYRGGRRLCHHEGHAKGAKPEATHTGRANGIAMMTGCEFHAYQWLRETLAMRRKR